LALLLQTVMLLVVGLQARRESGQSKEQAGEKGEKTAMLAMHARTRNQCSAMALCFSLLGSVDRLAVDQSVVSSLFE
jgi:hypothetical protein